MNPCPRLNHWLMLLGIVCWAFQPVALIEPTVTRPSIAIMIFEEG